MSADRKPGNSLPAVACLLFAATFWGIVWYPLRLLDARGLNGPWQMLVAYGSAFLVLAALRWPGAQGMRGQGGRLWVLALAAGWTNVGFILAMLDGSVARALILFYLSPLWTALLGHLLLGERLRPIALLTIPMGLLGAGLMLWAPDILHTGLSWGDMAAMTAGMAFALSNVITRALHQMGTRQKTLVSWAGVVMVSLVLLLIDGGGIPHLPAGIWLADVFLGVGGFLVTTLAVIYGVSHMPVQRSSVILLMEILVGAVSAWLLAGESLNLREWLGGILIILAALVAIAKTDHEQTEGHTSCEHDHC
ncbi:DMT family transporter [Thiolapillus brandeum]|nr:DMT family transporter [Thiolapillus brandeum]